MVWLGREIMTTVQERGSYCSEDGGFSDAGDVCNFMIRSFRMPVRNTRGTYYNKTEPEVSQQQSNTFSCNVSLAYYESNEHTLWEENVLLVLLA